jgi:hypothetical protein
MPEESWTERPHWVVMVVEAPGEERAIGHYEHREEARAHQRRAVKRYGRGRAFVRRTS